MAPSTSSFKSIDSTHRLRITIDQIGQNQKNGTSDVRVRGYMYNDSDYRNWNLDNVVDRQIFGEDHWSPPNFSFDLAPHTNMIFIEHVFTVDHNDNGTKTVNFTVKYGDTQISTFDGPQQLGDSLILDRIGKLPNAPGVVTFTNVAPRSLTARWAACSDDNGSAIETYELLYWNVQGASYLPFSPSLPFATDANNLSRNVTGLKPGNTYIFKVRCRNGIGWSAYSAERDVTLMVGGLLRVGGKWTASTAYVRKSGKWHVATPYVRHGGNWTRVE
jgi:Fibronectin type III domain/Siphovirus protein of unknown function (DUF859)